MKIRELIERLELLDGDMEVRIAQPTHDHWRNTKAAEIDEVDETEVTRSDYHDGDILASGDGDEADLRTVLLIS